MMWLLKDVLDNTVTWHHTYTCITVMDMTITQLVTQKLIRLNLIFEWRVPVDTDDPYKHRERSYLVFPSMINVIFNVFWYFIIRTFPKLVLSQRKFSCEMIIDWFSFLITIKTQLCYFRVKKKKRKKWLVLELMSVTAVIPSL